MSVHGGKADFVRKPSGFAARIVAHGVERVLADIDADRGIGCLRHFVLLVFGAPYQLRLLAGQEHGRTIPLADVGR
jgi:hypothetical protein